MSIVSEYKRLISYIYNYEKGLKKNNVGFAKLELRNGQCKIAINVKASSLNGQNLKAYVFYRENNKMIEILLADTVVENGIFEWKGITSASDIMNSGCDFEKLSGVIVYHSMQKYYATEWDDQPIYFDRIIEWQDSKSVRKENNVKKVEATNTPKLVKVPKEEITYVKQKEEATKQVEESQEEIVKSILKSIDTGLELFRSQKTSKQQSLQVASLSDSILERPVKALEHNLLNQEISKETATLVGYQFIDWYRSKKTGFLEDEVAVASQCVQEEQEDNIESNIDQEVNEQEEEQVQSAQYHDLYDNRSEDNTVSSESTEERMNSILKDNDELCQPEDENEWKERLEEASKKKVSTAERMLKKYPAINPFEDDEILACVRIEPGDIGLFPIENWILGNNSFLLHGYYNFRHLIFAKRRILDGEEYILGVPGIYQNREKFMAKMFGFTQFKCCKITEQKTGEFGYWYVKINM